jgi:hypothetical protein
LVWSLMVRARLCVCVYSCLSHGVVGRVWQQAAEGIAASESRRLGVTVSIKDFKKKGKVVRPRTYAIERFQLLLPIFHKGLPADLCAAVEHADSSCAMYRSEPALMHLSLICKYGPFKACMFKAWQDHQGQQPSRGLLLHHCGPFLQQSIVKTSSSPAGSPGSPQRRLCGYVVGVNPPNAYIPASAEVAWGRMRGKHTHHRCCCIFCICGPCLSTGGLPSLLVVYVYVCVGSHGDSNQEQSSSEPSSSSRLRLI